MSKRDLLVEVGTEEIPAQLVAPAAKQLMEKVIDWLQEHRIDFDNAAWFGTPRRFSTVIYGVAEQQKTLNQLARGPAKRIAVSEAGEWTKAAIGFARGQGVTTDELFFQQYKGEDYVYAQKQQDGAETVALLQQELKTILTSLTFPRSMRWGSHDFRFVRPIHWLVTLYGAEVIPVELTGIQSNNMTRGHRFLGGEAEVEHAADYEETLRRQYVVVNPEARQQQIQEQLQQLADKNGWVIPVDPDLLDEVTYLVEYPTAVTGSFDHEFLDIPEDVLMTSMREHQRYFPVKSADGQLLPHFVTIRNGDETSIENVAKGNEKVLRARLADARFFFHEDQKRPLSFFNDKLTHVVFHEQLGTIADKVERIRSIANELASELAYDEQMRQMIDRTAYLCKFDLETLMVNEFPELQGRMGERYARIAGEDPLVADGIFEHYLPRAAGDRLPNTKTGLIVGLADKIDTVAACFGIGIVPTGSTDPYALRRQASGIVQVILECDVPLLLDRLVSIALHELDKSGKLLRPKSDVQKELEQFFEQRLKYVLQNNDVRHDVVDAVLQSGLSHLQLTVAKAKLLMKKIDQPAFKRTLEAFNRVENLAVKAVEPYAFSETLTQETAEKHLFATYHKALKQYDEAEQNKDAVSMYEALAAMETAIHGYFSDVMVMVDDVALRNNRLALLKNISDLIRRFAHFNVIQQKSTVS